MKYLTFMLVLPLLICCSQEPNRLEERLIGDFITELAESYYEPHFIPPPYSPIHPDSLIDMVDTEDGVKTVYTSVSDSSERKELLEEYQQFDWEKYHREYNRWEKEQKRIELDTPEIILMEDSLFPINKDNYLYKKLKSRNLESDYLLDNLLDSLNSAKKIDLNRISDTGKFRIIREEKGFDFKRVEVLGLFKFSRISFSKDYKQALFIVDFTCGGECGGRELIWAKEDAGKWKITKRHLLAVS